MSISRQWRPRVRSYSITHPPGRVALPTEPGWDQLLLAGSGAFTALTDSAAWTIPTHRALCVPDGERVRIETGARVGIKCLYVATDLGAFGTATRVVTLSPLARELTLHAVAAAPFDLRDPGDAACITLLSDEIGRRPGAPLHLPRPVDPVARAVADAIMADPADALSGRLAAVGANRRTIERRFRAETAMSLGAWRRRARILASVAQLTEGETVTNVAVAVGYSSPSSFVAAFRAELGTPPGTFLREPTTQRP